MKQEQMMKMMKGEKPLVMMVKVVIARVIIVAAILVVTLEILGQ